jgi:hypothetical protein
VPVFGREYVGVEEEGFKPEKRQVGENGGILKFVDAIVLKTGDTFGELA